MLVRLEGGIELMSLLTISMMLEVLFSRIYIGDVEEFSNIQPRAQPLLNFPFCNVPPYYGPGSPRHRPVCLAA